MSKISQKNIKVMIGIILAIVLITMLFILTSFSEPTTAASTNSTTMERSLKYSSWQEEEHRRDFFETYVDTYIVYVKNEDYQTGYFIVEFIFEDYYGNEFTDFVSHYIPAKQEKEFFFRDIQENPYKYYSWKYKIHSETKVLDKNYQ